jgi:hypothetical protein
MPGAKKKAVSGGCTQTFRLSLKIRIGGDGVVGGSLPNHKVREVLV